MSKSIEEAYNNEHTPEDIAKILFSKEPQAKNTCQLLLDQVDNEYIFELLLNILLNGIDILFGKDINLDDVNEGSISLLNLYMESLGYKLSVIVENNDNLEYLLFTDLTNDNYYCELKINDFPDYFINYTRKHSGHNKYSKKYRFILNGSNHIRHRDKLNDYYCIYFTKDKQKKLTIKFKYNY